jgi:ankyrin repeat protein
MINRAVRSEPKLESSSGSAWRTGTFLGLILFFLLAFMTSTAAPSLAGTPDRTVAPVSTLQTGDLHALVVGVSAYRDEKIPRLDLADKDAQAFGEFLQTQKKVFKDIHVKFLLNEKATKSEVEKYLYYTLRKTGKNDTIILYFSGHGAYDQFRPTDKDFLFLTYDSEADYLGTTAVKMSGLDFLKGIEAERVLIIADACYSGGFSEMKAKAVAPSLQLFLNEVRSSSGRAVITSGTEGQLSWEIPGRKNSVFTQALIEGLKGKADLDRDGVVTLNEAYQYARTVTKDQTGGRQHPQFEGKVVGVFPLSYVGQAVPPIELKRSVLVNAATGDVDQMERLLRFSGDPNARDDDNDTPLIISSRHGRTDVVKLLLQSGADLNARNQSRDTALAAASERGQVDVVKLLLDAGGSVHSRNLGGLTPLALASREGRVEVVKLLLSRGADVKARTVQGRTALILAASKGHADVVKILLDRAADVSVKDLDGATAWTAAARNGHPQIVDLLLRAGVEITARSGAFLDTQLILAALSDDSARAKEVLRLGARVNAETESGDSALALASGLGHVKLMRLLLDQGANVDQRSHGEDTPLLLAARNGRVKVVQVLLERGAAVDTSDKDGNSSLFIATRNNDQEMVRVLLAHHAGMNARNQDGRTALMRAAEGGHAEVVRMVLAAGADQRAVDRTRNTALHVAAQNGHAEAVKLLCEKRSDVNARNNQGCTPLMVAARNGHKAVVKQLLSKGADMNAQDWEGKTAVAIASELDRKDLLELLAARRPEPADIP